MDRLIKRLDCTRDADLSICEPHGIAYQRDMKALISYGAEYFKKVSAYEGNEIAVAVNASRCNLLKKYLPEGATVLDIGAGTGAFVRAAVAAGFAAKGFDVMPETVAILKKADLYSEETSVDGITMWDTIEHLDAPEVRLKRVRRGGHIFVSVPIFEDLNKIRESKHYRPGEHLYYWTRDGFIKWMGWYGFRLLEESSHEIDAGREAIGAFVFVKDLPDYHYFIEQYSTLHAGKFYGASSAELHLDDATWIVRNLKATSIIDYGCGRSDLVTYFYLDGKRRVAKYDPAIFTYKEMPSGGFDLSFCCDVMEHIPFTSVDRVLTELRGLSPVSFFTISLKLARAKLPDGQNAHVTILTRGEWLRWIASYFGRVQELPSKWEHELVLLAGAKVPQPPPKEPQ